MVIGTTPARIEPARVRSAPGAQVERWVGGPEPEVEPEPKRLDHAGRGATVSVSSTHLGWPGEGLPDTLVDGDLETRWASAYSEPQHVTIDLGEPVKLKMLRLHWEDAAAVRYAVLRQSAGKWITVREVDMQNRTPAR